MSKKVILEKAVPVSTTKDYREPKKSKVKGSSSSEKNKNKQVVSCEDISSAISPNTSSPGPPIKPSKSKAHEIVYAETSSPPPLKKSKSSKGAQHHNNVNSTSSSHSSKSGKSKSALQVEPRERSHEREKKDRESRESIHDRGRRRDSRDYSSRSRSRSRSESVSSTTSSSDLSSDGTSSSTNALNSDIGTNNSSPGSSGGGGSASSGGGGGGGGGGFSHAGVAGSITAEMKLLKELHAKITSLDDPDKLQEIVDIVEACGKDAWTVENGITFDFDLCKLNAKAIGKLKQAILL